MQLEPSLPGGWPSESITRTVMDVIVNLPTTQECLADNPATRAKAIARQAARSASMTAGALALPPEAMGWLTVVPEMMAVWKIQAQIVADIAGICGQVHTLGREQMLRCMFKHASAQLLRDLAVRVGERALLQKISVHLTRKILPKGASRLIPLLGAVGVGAYAYADTLQVAKIALSIFESAAPTPVGLPTA